MASIDKVKALLGDLGKPTLRGVRKCPKCGTYNGTRGISCKNKLCDVVFKETDRKRGHSADAVKVLTGSTVQVFSVRLRDRGPDYRGFVQLPLVQDLEGNPADVVDPSVLASASRCYVESCSKSNDIDLSKAPCSHIKAAIECRQEAQPLSLKNSVLNSLKVTNEIKQAIWLLATETTGPLVQRVTKNIMVVKCKPDPKQPLGFLHFSLYETSRNRSEPEHKFHCSCRSFKNFKPGLSRDDNSRRCVHFYACICAFASEEILTSEFAYYIHLDNALSQLCLPHESCTQQLLTLTEVVDEDVATDVVEHATMEVVVLEEELLTTPPTKRKKHDDGQASNALLTLQEGNLSAALAIPSLPLKKEHTIRREPAINKAINIPKKPDETEIGITFEQWLSSVTERINQTMHYQFDGNPEPLVFHVPQVFFDCLQQRISVGHRKKRLPNSTTGFVRRDALPLGMFTKYTWIITSLAHVKQIFQSNEVPLEVTRMFVENRDGTYDLYEAPKVSVEKIDDAYKPKSRTPIRPSELKTYLRVGTLTPEQKDPTPFIIEWIPDILPHSQIGELRIKFEYGHQRNGAFEKKATIPQPLAPAPAPLPHPIQTITEQEIQTIDLQEISQLSV